MKFCNESQNTGSTFPISSNDSAIVTIPGMFLANNSILSSIMLRSYVLNSKENLSKLPLKILRKSIISKSVF